MIQKILIKIKKKLNLKKSIPIISRIQDGEKEYRSIIQEDNSRRTG